MNRQEIKTGAEGALLLSHQPCSRAIASDVLYPDCFAPSRDESECDFFSLTDCNAFPKLRKSYCARPNDRLRVRAFERGEVREGQSTVPRVETGRRAGPNAERAKASDLSIGTHGNDFFESHSWFACE